MRLRPHLSPQKQNASKLSSFLHPAFWWDFEDELMTSLRSITCQRYALLRVGQRTVASSPTDPTSVITFVGQQPMSTKSSRVPSPPNCPWSNQPSSSWSSISKQRNKLA